MTATLSARHSFFVSLGSCARGDRRLRIERSPQYSNGRFRNPVATLKIPPGTLWQTLKLQFTNTGQRHPESPIPVVHPTTADYLTPPVSGLRATWMGHASSLIEIDGTRILIDPVWGRVVSPFRHIGPKRFHSPPIAIADLPPIDVVLISHDHYDHLDYPTIRALAARNTRFVTSLGVGSHLERWGVPPGHITELDWHEWTSVNDVEIRAHPARHFSGRRFTDENATLWSSWTFLGPEHRVYYSGDTGMLDASDVGRQYGPFDLTIMAIGAYGPTWPDVHITPEEAIIMHRQVQGRVMLPVHWGTFNLAFHDWREPAERALAAAAAEGVTLVTPKAGEMVEPATAPKPSPWWRRV